MISRSRIITGLLICLYFGPSLQAQWRPSKEMQEINRNTMFLREFFKLTYNQDLMRELEVVGDQHAAIKSLGNEFQQKMLGYKSQNDSFIERTSELQNRIVENNNADDRGELRKLSTEYYQEVLGWQSKTIKAIDEVLLPHQLKRIQQITKQQSLKWNQSSDFLGMPYALSDELELSAAQKRNLKSRTTEVREQYLKDVAELREKAIKEIKKELTREQREDFEELVGEFFDSDKAQRNTYKNIFKDDKK